MSEPLDALTVLDTAHAAVVHLLHEQEGEAAGARYRGHSASADAYRGRAAFLRRVSKALVEMMAKERARQDSLPKRYRSAIYGITVELDPATKVPIEELLGDQGWEEMR